MSREELREQILKAEPSNPSAEVVMHKAITNRLRQIYIDKNADYGDSVHDTFKKYGLISFLVRMEDKLNRLKSLTEKEGEVPRVNESIEDTLLDLSNYAILALIEVYKERSERK